MVRAGEDLSRMVRGLVFLALCLAAVAMLPARGVEATDPLGPALSPLADAVSQIATAPGGKSGTVHGPLVEAGLALSAGHGEPQLSMRAIGELIQALVVAEQMDAAWAIVRQFGWNYATSIGEGHIRRGAYDEAVALARILDDAQSRNGVLYSVLYARVERKELNAARAVLREFAPAPAQVTATLDVARALRAAGATGGADEVLTEALTAARALSDATARSTALHEVASAYLYAGRQEQATAMVRELGEEGSMWQLTMLVGGGRGPKDLDSLEALLRAAQQRPDLVERPQAVSMVASAMAKAGFVERAITVSRTLPADNAIWVFTNLAGDAGRRGDREGALEAVREALALFPQLSSEFTKGTAIINLVPWLARVGEVDRGFEIAAMAPSASDKRTAYFQMYAMSRKQLPADQARALLREVLRRCQGLDDNTSGTTLRDQVGWLLLDGQVEEAMLAIEVADSPESRGEMMGMLARHFAEQHQFDRARDALGRMPAEPPWVRDWAAKEIADQLTATGRLDEAIDTASGIASRAPRALALFTVCVKLIEKKLPAAEQAKWAERLLAVARLDQEEDGWSSRRWLPRWTERAGQTRYSHAPAANACVTVPRSMH